MKRLNDQMIIGVDHGYGNIKTVNHCFKTGMPSLSIPARKKTRMFRHLITSKNA